MEYKTTIDLKARQQRITNVLLLNASFIDNLGLMHGKMGIAIYFYHLARKTQNKIYENYAGELIDEIYEGISLHTTLDFENGLAGIGWGIEYLVQNGFIQANTDEVLEDFDNKIQLTIGHFESIGLLEGIMGLGAYYLKRLQNPTSSDNKISINKKILGQLIDELELRIEKDKGINLFNDKKGFSIIWDYPILISFLCEVKQLNIFNAKVSCLLKEVINPLFKQTNLPNLQSHRLLLVLILKKYQKNLKNLVLERSTDVLYNDVLSLIQPSLILSELATKSPYMENGSRGLAWIFNELFILTSDAKFQKESIYWSDKSIEFEEAENVFDQINITNEKRITALGLLKGLAGIVLFEENKHLFSHG